MINLPRSQPLANTIVTKWYDIEQYVVLPVRWLAAEQLHVWPEHGVEEGVRATQPNPHDCRRGYVGVAVLL